MLKPTNGNVIIDVQTAEDSGISLITKVEVAVATVVSVSDSSEMGTLSHLAKGYEVVFHPRMLGTFTYKESVVTYIHKDHIIAFVKI